MVFIEPNRGRCPRAQKPVRGLPEPWLCVCCLEMVCFFHTHSQGSWVWVGIGQFTKQVEPGCWGGGADGCWSPNSPMVHVLTFAGTSSRKCNEDRGRHRGLALPGQSCQAARQRLVLMGFVTHAPTLHRVPASHPQPPPRPLPPLTAHSCFLCPEGGGHVQGRHSNSNSCPCLRATASPSDFFSLSRSRTWAGIY